MNATSGPFACRTGTKAIRLTMSFDGQQRVTSIFGVFQTNIEPDPSVQWSEVYFDFAADVHAQESQFVALRPEDVDSRRHSL